MKPFFFLLLMLVTANAYSVVKLGCVNAFGYHSTLELSNDNDSMTVQLFQNGEALTPSLLVHPLNADKTELVVVRKGGPLFLQLSMNAFDQSIRQKRVGLTLFYFELDKKIESYYQCLRTVQP